MKKIFYFLSMIMLFLISTSLSANTNKYSSGLNFLPPERYRALPVSATPNVNVNNILSADISGWFPPVRSQGGVGSCVGFALAGIQGYRNSIATGRRSAHFSSAFIYNLSRASGSCQDAGTYPDNAFKKLKLFGAPLEKDYPYSNVCKSIPNNHQKNLAKRYRAVQYSRLSNINENTIKSHIIAGNPIFAAIQVSNELFSPKPNGVTTLGKPLRGGHAVVIVGYDDRKKAFKIRNSWGVNWGNRGHAWFSMRSFISATREAYILRDNNLSIFPSSNSILGDFNGDKLSDIAVARLNSSGAYIRTYYQRSNGAMGSVGDIKVANGTGGNYKPISGDFNGDNIDDIAFVNQSEQYGLTAYISYGTKGQGFKKAFIAKNINEGKFSGTYKLRTGDVDRDNKDEILFMHQSRKYGVISKAFSVNSSQLRSFRQANIKTDFGGVYELRTGDVNGDRVIDIVLSHRSKKHGWVVHTYFGKGNNQYSVARNDTIKTNFGGDYKFELVDINNDQKDDFTLNHRSKQHGWVVYWRNSHSQGENLNLSSLQLNKVSTGFGGDYFPVSGHFGVNSKSEDLAMIHTSPKYGLIVFSRPSELNFNKKITYHGLHGMH